MRRREFITFVSGAAASYPFSAWGQGTLRPTIGYLHGASPGPFRVETSAFRKGLADEGYTEGLTVAIEYRWAEGEPQRLPVLAADLVRQQVALIAAIGGDATALAAKAATTTIPIVFLNGSDPVKAGLVKSINRPGENVTGVSLFAGTVEAKRLELLHEMVPQAKTIAALNNLLVAETESRSVALARAAGSIGLELHFINANNDDELDAAFELMSKQRVGALFVSGSPFFLDRREKIAQLAARSRLPAVYAWRQIVTVGGLMSYGTSVTASARQAGVYAGQILKGSRPAEMPVMQPATFELVINLKTAEALGLTVPPTLLARADEVIE